MEFFSLDEYLSFVELDGEVSDELRKKWLDRINGRKVYINVDGDVENVIVVLDDNEYYWGIESKNDVRFVEIEKELIDEWKENDLI